MTGADRPAASVCTGGVHVMAGTMPHAIFIETDVDGNGLVGAYAAELPGCAVFAATDDEAAAAMPRRVSRFTGWLQGGRRVAGRLRRRQLVRGRAGSGGRGRRGPPASRLHPGRAAADRQRVRGLAALARAGARGARIVARLGRPVLGGGPARRDRAPGRRVRPRPRRRGTRAVDGPDRPPLRGA